MTYEAPGSETGEGTTADSINSEGVVAEAATRQGASQNLWVFFGSIREPDGKFIRFQAPGAFTGGPANGNYTGTQSVTIDDNGDVAGGYYDSSLRYHGYIRKADGRFIKFDPPGSYGTEVCYPNCLNDDGSVAGMYFDAHAQTHGFYRDPSGPYTEFPNVSVGGLNARHELTGTYLPTGAGWIRYPDGRTIRYQAPGAQGGTAGWSINSKGNVGGVYFDSGDTSHGFLRAADGKFTAYHTPSYYGLIPYAINSSDAEAGAWSDSAGVIHGFVWTP